MPLARAEGAKCSEHKTLPNTSSGTLEQLFTTNKSACLALKASKMCQDVYAKIKQNGSKVEEYALDCTERNVFVQSVLDRSQTIAGCAVGGYDATLGAIVNLVRRGSERAAQFTLDLEKEQEINKVCSAQLANKKKLFAAANLSRPKVLWVKIPSDEKLNKMSCSEISQVIISPERKRLENWFASSIGPMAFSNFAQNSRFNKDEKEYLSWYKKQIDDLAASQKPSAGIWAAAKARLHQMGVEIECYNNLRATAIVCENLADAAMLVTGAGAAVSAVRRASKVAELAGLERTAQAADVGQTLARSENLQAGSNITMNTDRAAQNARVRELAARDGYNATEANEMRGVVAQNARLTDAARKTKLRENFPNLNREVIDPKTGKKINLVDAVVDDVHAIGRAEGGRVGAYTPEQIRAKLKRLKELGVAKEDREVLIRMGYAGDFENYARAGASQVTNEASLFKQKLAAEQAIARLNSELSATTDPTKIKALSEKIEQTELGLTKIHRQIMGSDLTPTQAAEQMVGRHSLNVAIAEESGSSVRLAHALQGRRQGLSSLAENSAAQGDLSTAVHHYENSVGDIQRLYQMNKITNEADKLRALRELAQTRAGRESQAFHDLSYDIASSAARRNGPQQVAESLQFPSNSVSQTSGQLASGQLQRIWQLRNEFLETEVRLSVRNAHHDVSYVGGSRTPAKADAQLEQLLQKKEEQKQAITSLLQKQYGEKWPARMRELGLD